jgi:hypothetical protein
MYRNLVHEHRQNGGHFPRHLTTGLHLHSPYPRLSGLFQYHTPIDVPHTQDDDNKSHSFDSVDMHLRGIVPLDYSNSMDSNSNMPAAFGTTPGPRFPAPKIVSSGLPTNSLVSQAALAERSLTPIPREFAPQNSVVSPTYELYDEDSIGSMSSELDAVIQPQALTDQSDNYDINRYFVDSYKIQEGSYRETNYSPTMTNDDSDKRTSPFEPPRSKIRKIQSDNSLADGIAHVAATITDNLKIDGSENSIKQILAKVANATGTTCTTDDMLFAKPIARLPHTTWVSGINPSTTPQTMKSLLQHSVGREEMNSDVLFPDDVPFPIRVHAHQQSSHHAAALMMGEVYSKMEPVDQFEVSPYLCDKLCPDSISTPTEHVEMATSMPENAPNADSVSVTRDVSTTTTTTIAVGIPEATPTQVVSDSIMTPVANTETTSTSTSTIPLGNDGPCNSHNDSGTRGIKRGRNVLVADSSRSASSSDVPGTTSTLTGTAPCLADMQHPARTPNRPASIPKFQVRNMTMKVVGKRIARAEYFTKLVDKHCIDSNDNNRVVKSRTYDQSGMRHIPLWQYWNRVQQARPTKLRYMLDYTVLHFTDGECMRIRGTGGVCKDGNPAYVFVCENAGSDLRPKYVLGHVMIGRANRSAPVSRSVRDLCIEWIGPFKSAGDTVKIVMSYPDPENPESIIKINHRIVLKEHPGSLDW